MIIRKLKATNIFCFKDIEYSFSNNGLFLLEGYNQETKTSNGSGKSSFINLISYCIYNELSKDISTSEILFDGSKSGKVEIDLDVKDKNIKIIRGRPTLFEVYINDVKLPLTQEALEKEIGLNKKQFILTMFNYQFNINQFLFLNDTNKKQFILDLLNIKDFEKVKEKVSIDVKVLEKEIASNTGSLNFTSNQITELTQHLLPTSDITKIKTSISDLTDKIKEIDKDIDDLDLIQPDMSKYKGLEDKIKEKEANFSLMQKQLQEFSVHLSIKERMLNNLQTTTSYNVDSFKCPCCSNEVIIKNNNLILKSVNEKNEALKISQLQKEEANNVQTLILNINNLKDKLSKRSDLDAFKEKLANQKNQDMVTYTSNLKIAHELKNQIFKINVSINDLKRALETDLNNQNKLSKLINIENQIKSKIDTDQKKLMIKETVLNICSPTGAQAFIMDNVLDILNSYIQDNLNLCFPEMTYILKPFAETKKTIVSKFQEDITIDGTPRSLGSLSGGETSLLSLCINMAIVDLFYSNFSTLLSPIILDETLTSMDHNNKEKAIKLLKTLSSKFMIILVDHTSETKSTFDQVITITKQNQVSTIS